MLCRGGKLTRWDMRDVGDATWSVDDCARARTYEARWRALGVEEGERQRLIPCAILLAKWPGTQFPPAIMDALRARSDMRSSSHT